MTWSLEASKAEPAQAACRIAPRNLLGVRGWRLGHGAQRCGGKVQSQPYPQLNIVLAPVL